MKNPVVLLVGAAACGPLTSRPLPSPALPDHVTWVAAAAVVDSAVLAAAAPGAVLAVSAGGVRYVHGTGRLGQDDDRMPDPDTIYDLASLTKVVALTTLLMHAVAERRVALDAPVRRYLPDFRGPGKDGVTVRHLLTHSSGLPAHRRLWEEAPDRAAALALIDTTALNAPAGTVMVYSDLGAMVLTQVVEAVYGEPLDVLASRRIFAPLRMPRTRFRPPSEWLPVIAPTELDTWRGRVVHGEVHDENASWLGGVSGHAGLFSSATDLLRFGEWLLAQARGTGDMNPAPLLPTRTVREFTRRQDVVAGSSRALGWDTPSSNSSGGSHLSLRSFGHTGFTGTSIWIDPERDLVIVLLSNRVHPTRENTAWLRVRGSVADAVVRVLNGAL